MAQMDRRQTLKLLAALGVTGLAAACGADDTDGGAEAVSDEPVRIGIVAPQSGPLKRIGEELVNGFRVYLDLNDGRLGGHPVDLVVVDEGDSTRSGKAAIDRLLAQGVLAVTGVASSSLLLTVRSRIEDAKVPLLAANGTPESLQGVIYIWCTSYVDDEPGEALGQYMARKVVGKVAIVAPSFPPGQDAVNGFRQAFNPTDSRISEPVIWTTPNLAPPPGFFAEAIGEVQAMDAAAIYCYYAGPAAVAFVKELRAAGVQAQIYAPGLLTEGDVLAELDKEAEGIFTALNYSADLNNNANRRFAAAFRKAHGSSPSASAVASYDAAQVLDKAVRIAGEKPTPQDLNLAIGRVGQIDSPRGVWQFNQPRTPQQRWYLRQVRRDGQVLSNVTISELSTLG